MFDFWKMSYFFIKCEFSLSDYSFQSGNGEILGTVSLIVSIFHFIQYPSIPAKLLQQHQKFPDPKTYHSSIDHLSYNLFLSCSSLFSMLVYCNQESGKPLPGFSFNKSSILTHASPSVSFGMVHISCFPTNSP